VRAVVLVVSSSVMPGWGTGGLYVEGRRRGVRRRSGRGVLTRGRVVYASFDGKRTSVRSVVLSELVDASTVPHEGSGGWGWLTLCSLDLSRYFSSLLRLFLFVYSLCRPFTSSLSFGLAIRLVLVELGWRWRA
jgi:hypothetical protein